MRNKRSAYRDPDLVELLRDEPELLAIADAVMNTHGRPRRTRQVPGIAWRVARGRGTGMRSKIALTLVGAAAVLAATLGVKGAVTHHGAPVRAAAAATEADAPDALVRLRETGGLKGGVTFAQIARARKQALAINSTTGSWEYAGANNIGGRVTDVVVDPTTPNTIYVASAGGGVWKSTDAGLTYTPAWPNDYPQAIGSLARGSDGTLWAGTGEANASGGGITYVGDGVYKSTDGGTTWTNVGLGNAGMIGRIAVDPRTRTSSSSRRAAASTRPAASAASSARSTAARTGRRCSRRPERRAVHGRRRRRVRPGRTRTASTRRSGITTAARTCGPTAASAPGSTSPTTRSRPRRRTSRGSGSATRT